MVPTAIRGAERLLQEGGEGGGAAVLLKRRTDFWLKISLQIHTTACMRSRS